MAFPLSVRPTCKLIFSYTPDFYLIFHFGVLSAWAAGGCSSASDQRRRRWRCFKTRRLFSLRFSGFPTLFLNNKHSCRPKVIIWVNIITFSVVFRVYKLNETKCLGLVIGSTSCGRKCSVKQVCLQLKWRQITSDKIQQQVSLYWPNRLSNVSDINLNNYVKCGLMIC